MALDALRGADRNPKKHALASLKTSLGRFGYVEPVVLDERSGQLVAGHGRTEALRALKAEGASAPRGVRVEGDVWLVPVLRGLAFTSQREAQAYLIASNKLTEAGGWERPDLAALLADLEPMTDGLLDAIGMTARELAKLTEKAPSKIGHQRDWKADDGADAITKLGDVIKLGPHRLVCGDSFSGAAAVALDGKLADLVLTDPPYAIYGSSSGISTDIADDKMVRPFFQGIARVLFDSVRDFAHVYVFCDWRSYSLLYESQCSARLSPKNCLVWDKGGGLGANYSNCHELITFFAKVPPQGAMKAVRFTQRQRTVNGGNVLRINRVTNAAREHNAQKPLELVCQLVENSAERGELVLDPFLGSGTTLLAAEQLGRVCVGCELDPRQCDRIVARWEAATGKRAER